MSTIDESSSFTAYKFSDDEILQAISFTTLQRQHLQNERARMAEAKIRLPYDPANPTQFVFEHEWHRGWIECLDYLIGLSDDFNIRLQERLAQEAEAQKEAELQSNNPDLQS